MTPVRTCWLAKKLWSVFFIELQLYARVVWRCVQSLKKPRAPNPPLRWRNFIPRRTTSYLASLMCMILRVFCAPYKGGWVEDFSFYGHLKLGEYCWNSGWGLNACVHVRLLQDSPARSGKLGVPHLAYLDHLASFGVQGVNGDSGDFRPRHVESLARSQRRSGSGFTGYLEIEGIVGIVSNGEG